MMKRIVTTLSLIVFSVLAYSQAAWIVPETPDVTKPVRIYVDLTKTTNTSCLNEPGPFYIWTWSPFEHKEGSSKVNGTGDKPWKNSNDVLMMTRDSVKGEKVWYYEMTPTEFYEVPAADVYSKGISLLVKPKDGGGYGDPDIKTEDLIISITPPKLSRGYIYNVPATILPNELVTIYYDNPIDTNAAMKNLATGDAYLWIKCTGIDTVTMAPVVYQPTPFFLVGDNPKLEMSKDPLTGKFYLTFVPETFFGFSPTFRSTNIECTVKRKTLPDRTSDQPKLKTYRCE
ncbi:MAG: hypothetical protein KA981_03130 [Bacteroidia bacterium]|jgi:hypothetical protein|nr:hypothetical protein [Bacteroidia bacterium]